MIYGIGTDIVEIYRIQEAIDHNPNFLTRFYSEKEQSLIRSSKNPAKRAAINFAGKEAVAKALQTGFTDQIRGEEIQILRKTSGAPYVHCLGTTADYLADLGVCQIHVSLSDTKDSYAIAYAIVETKDSNGV